MNKNTRIKQKNIKSFSIVLISFQCLLLVIIVCLYILDHDKTNLNAIKCFIRNEYSMCYSDSDELIDICEDSTSISKLLKKYNARRFDLELSVTNKDIEELSYANDLVDTLLPVDLQECNYYVRSWIYSYAIHDARNVVNPDCKDFYEIQYYMLSELRLHEVYLVGNPYRVLYENLDNIVSTIISIQIMSVFLGIAYIIEYYTIASSILHGGKRNE